MSNQTLRVVIGIEIALFALLLVFSLAKALGNDGAKEPVTGVTNQPAVKVVKTPTPITVETLVPTPTPKPTSSPTPTPIPTPSPIPTPTPDPNTPPGTILAPGQDWYKDGVTLTLLEKTRMTPGSFDGWIDCWGNVDLRLYFRVSNETNDPITFDTSGNNFVVTNNLGQEFNWTKGGEGRCTTVGTMVLNAGQTTKEGSIELYGDAAGDIIVSLLGEYSNAMVSYIEVTVIGLSRIDHATWRIPINH